MRWASALLLSLAACAPDQSAVWQAYQSDLLRYGYLRLDRAPRDIRYTNQDIAAAFQRIMFFDEYVLEDGSYKPGLTARELEKRTEPVTYALAGASVTDADKRHLEEIATRLQRVTGLQIKKVDQDASIHLFIAGSQERKVFAEILARRRADSPLIRELRNDLGGNVCIAVPFRPKDGAGDAHYLIFIPAEVKGRLRRACIEEEFAQAFGPAADFDGARPSIFNDDQEFALFTEHDAWMFRVLYDARMQPGMVEAQAMPIVRRILAEIRPEQ
ncbi:MAG: DUF2927 domain-containing protein [Paracoccaceae bacterium]